MIEVHIMIIAFQQTLFFLHKKAPSGILRTEQISKEKNKTGYSLTI